MFPFDKALAALTQFPAAPTRIAAFDAETTGLNLRHGDRPFLWTFTYDDGSQEMWQAEVDPYTRLPKWDYTDLLELHNRFSQPDWLYVGSNTKFDVRCAEVMFDDAAYELAACLPSSPSYMKRQGYEFDPLDLLYRCHDTIMQHHAFSNAESHKLKDATVKYCGIPDTDEKDLREAVKACRVFAKRLGWKIASAENCPACRKAPSQKVGGWAVMDYWLPRQYALRMWRTSEAYKYISLLVCDHDKDSPDPIRHCYLDLSIHQAKVVHSKSGWEWHPPEINVVDVHPYHTVASKYCFLDTFRSQVSYKMFSAALAKENLSASYLENRPALAVSYEAEAAGITINKTTCSQKIETYKLAKSNAELALKACINQPVFNAKSPIQVRKILYEYFGLPVTRYTKKSEIAHKKDPKKSLNPTTDGDYVAEVLRLSIDTMKEEGDNFEDFAPPQWQKGVERYADYKAREGLWYKSLVQHEKPSSRQLMAFSSSLLMYKKLNTSIGYLEGYLSACLPLSETRAQASTAWWTEYCCVPGSPEKTAATLSIFPEPSYGVLYPSLNPVGPKSTRYSSSNPNGQNISKGGKGKKGLEWLFKTSLSLRDVFGPAPGREWWSFDYQQAQLVIFAVKSGDKKMLAAIAAGQDFHEAVARALFGDRMPLTEDENSALFKYYRDIAKTLNFAFIFGAQRQKLERILGDEGSYELLISAFPEAVEFLERTEKFVRRHGYVMADSYRLYLNKDHAYAGVNYIVQGYEGIMVKRAQYGIHAWLHKTLPSQELYRSSMFVHDELLFDSQRNFGYSLCGNVLGIMNDAAMSYGIPCKAEAKLITENWSKGKKVGAV